MNRPGVAGDYLVQVTRPYACRSRIPSTFIAARSLRVVDEDALVAPLLQRTVASKNFILGRMSWLEEAVHHQMRYNVERTFS
jgi:hypothetical protein